MTFQTWIEPDADGWPFGEEFKLSADLKEVDGSISIGSIRVEFRGCIDITSAFLESELQRFTKLICENYRLEKESA